MVSCQCKNGPNKGRLFWRCPYWRNADTCNMFIWEEDLGAKSGNEDGSIMNSELEIMASMEYMKTLCEESRKKNKNLKTKLKTEKFHGKLKMLCFALSFMINVYFILKCNCWI